MTITGLGFSKRSNLCENFDFDIFHRALNKKVKSHVDRHTAMVKDWCYQLKCIVDKYHVDEHEVMAVMYEYSNEK